MGTSVSPVAHYRRVHQRMVQHPHAPEFKRGIMQLHNDWRDIFVTRPSRLREQERVPQARMKLPYRAQHLSVRSPAALSNLVPFTIGAPVGVPLSAILFATDGV